MEEDFSTSGRMWEEQDARDEGSGIKTFNFICFSVFNCDQVSSYSTTPFPSLPFPSLASSPLPQLLFSRPLPYKDQRPKTKSSYSLHDCCSAS